MFQRPMPQNPVSNLNTLSIRLWSQLDTFLVSNYSSSFVLGSIRLAQSGVYYVFHAADFKRSNEQQFKKYVDYFLCIKTV